MSRKIIYVGCERCDFIYHLITVLSTKGSVLAIDNSYKGDLFSCVNRDDDPNVYEWRNMTFTRNLDIESDMSDYEFVVLYAGEAPCNEWFEKDDAYVLIMPDYTRPSIQAVGALTTDLTSENVTFIMRDKCNKKISEKSIATMLGVSIKKIEGIIPLLATDIGSYMTLTHNKHQNIKGISEEMTTAITYVVAKIFNVVEKQAVKIVSKARKVK